MLIIAIPIACKSQTLTGVSGGFCSGKGAYVIAQGFSHINLFVAARYNITIWCHILIVFLFFFELDCSLDKLFVCTICTVGHSLHHTFGAQSVLWAKLERQNARHSESETFHSNRSLPLL